MSGHKRIVIAGFSSFPGVPDNPTEHLIEAMKENPGLLPPAAEVRLLETAYAAVLPALEEILSPPPAALVLTGFSALARGLRLERQASDRRSPELADARGYRPARHAGEPIDRRQNRACDFPALETALRRQGFACHSSDDPGQYVCNAAYHAILSRVADRMLAMRAIFVHVPAITGTALAERSASSMPLDHMARGVALVARLLASD